MEKHWAGRFFTIWTGQAFSLFGSALVQFALVWWLTQKTGSPTILVIATLAGLLPQIILGPFAGALVDRWNRRLIMIVADAFIALFTLLLAYLFSTGQIQTWHVFAIMAIRSLGGAFHFPAMSASTPLMVPEKHLTRISGLNQMLQGLMGLVAPPVGALLITVFPTQGVLFIDVGTAMLAILPLLFWDVPQPKHQKDAMKKEQSLLMDISESLAYIRTWPGLVAILFMALFINFLLSPIGSLMPLLITNFFNKGALELGFMDSAWGGGVIAGGLILSAWGGFKKKVYTSMMGIMGIGIGVSIVGFVPASMFPLALVGMAFGGLMNPIANGPLFALLQSIVRPDMQGRTMSLVNTAATALMPLGLIIAGGFSEAIGIRTWFWIAGILTLLTGVVGLFMPIVVNVEETRNLEATAEAPQQSEPSIAD